MIELINISNIERLKFLENNVIASYIPEVNLTIDIQSA